LILPTIQILSAALTQGHVMGSVRDQFDSIGQFWVHSINGDVFPQPNNISRL